MEPTKTPRVLSGRYELSHLVARGGMAEVYRARDQLLDRPVALKVLFPELSVDRSFVERFRREAQAAANLSHPNIVPVFDWGEDAGTYFIVMEFVDGRALSSILRTAGPLHPDRAAEIAADVAGALAYAHRHGVVHRDVKPGNVLITEEGTIKVTDFGIARAVNTEESLTQTGAVMGTATYFSPEQAEGMGVDSRSDIYSLGVVLFEMVTGRPPFLGDTPVAVASKHVREHPPAPREVNPGVPPDLEAIILKCLAKSPDHRYATGDDLRIDLLRFREGRAVGATSPPTGQHPTVSTTQSVRAVGTQALPAVAGDDFEGGQEPNRTKLYAGLLALLLVALAVVIIFLGNSVGWWHIGEKANTSFALPDVTSQSVSKAEQTLQHKGLKTTVQVDKSATSTPDTDVLRTVPAKGTTVNKGDKVTLVTGAQGPPVSIPDLVGQSVTFAKSELQQKGLQANVQFSSTCTQQNIVCSQNPKSGQTITPGGTVNIFTQSTTTPVPDVTGLNQTTACNLLGQKGFQCGAITTQASSTVPKNDVISTSPAPGAQEPSNANVNLVVSSGPSSVLVPYVIGDTQAQAASALTSSGLSPVVICQLTLDPSQDGLVQAQSPNGGQTESPGTTVDITVGSLSGCSGSTTTTTTAPTGNTGGGGGGGDGGGGGGGGHNF
jgi:eukaryotic-like serine/threonine-protein kinase